MARGWRRVAAFVVLLGPTVALLLAAPMPAASACPSASFLSVSPRHVRPGQRITVTGTAFVCNPVGQAPVSHIAITFVQGSFARNLLSIATRSQFPFKAIVTIPAGARAGSALIEGVNGVRTARASVTV